MAISNASNQIVKVNLIPGIIPSVLHLSQYDTGAGRPITFSVYDGSQVFTIPSGISIAFEGTKPDGKGFSFSCTRSGSNVLLTNYTNQMTALSGKIMCQLVFTNTSGGRVGSLPVLMVVTPAGIDAETDLSPSKIGYIVDKYDLDKKVNAPTSNPNGTNGQLLRTLGNGKTEWVDEGLPTDGQTESAVTKWLNEHPEATTTVEDNSLTYKKIVTGTLNYVTPEMFGAKGDGITDDTTAFQLAINFGDGLVLCKKNKTYNVKKLTPFSDIIIDLNSSKLFLIDNTELPVFYDTNGGKNFTITNGVIDCNMDNNHAVNQSAGCFWLTNWKGLNINDIEVIHAYRNVINLVNCENVNISNVLIHDCGLDGDSRFTYGATFEPTCRNVFVKNFYVHDCYGYGLHFNETENFVLENCRINNLTGSSRIGITLTKAKNGKIDNIDFSTITSIGLEINASQKIAISNAMLSNCGGSTITIGDNGINIYNDRITFKNCETESTGGNYALLLNWAKNCTFIDCVFDKGVTTTTSLAPLGIENIFRDCSFPSVNVPNWFFAGQRFFADNCIFSDFAIVKKNNYDLIFSTKTGTIAKNGGSVNVQLDAAYNARGANGYIFSNNAMSSNYQQRVLQKIPFNLLVLGTSELVVGSSYRTLDFSFENKVLTITNNKDVDIDSTITFDMHIIPN